VRTPDPYIQELDIWILRSWFYHYEIPLNEADGSKAGFQRGLLALLELLGSRVRDFFLRRQIC
jgi:hypothetical protein